MNSFGEWLVEELEKRDISQSELARMSGLSRGTISNIISGTRGVSTESLAAIARVLKKPPEELYQMAGIPISEPKTNKERLARQILREIEDLPEEDQEGIIRYIHYVLKKKK